MKITTVILALLVGAVYCAPGLHLDLELDLGLLKLDLDLKPSGSGTGDSNLPVELLSYHEHEGIPAAARIMAAEQAGSNESTVDGSIADAYPFYAGIVIDLMSGQTSMCGASMLSDTRALTAAHCWWDGRYQARMFTLVFGSPRLFSGGTRVATSNVQVHSNFNPGDITNSVAVIGISSTTYINGLRPIVLPSGPMLDFGFAGASAITVGYGRTSNSFTRVEVITNSECGRTFGSLIQPSTMCVRGGAGACRGDGGPIVATINDTQILIGVMSFGLNRGCLLGLPATAARVTSFVSWINARL